MFGRCAEFLGSASTEWQIGDWPQLVNGRECLPIRQVRVGDRRVPESRVERIVYLDIAREYVPLRMTEGSPGEVQVTLDISYDRQEHPTWIPSAWKSEWLGRVTGKPIEASELHLKDVELGVALPESAFTIDFPPGTVVFDHNQQERQFVVGRDGSLRPYGLPESGPGAATYLLWGFVLAVFTLAAILYWRQSK